jgi:serine/threonine-protein kinase HipA
MRKSIVFVHNVRAGTLEELDSNKYAFEYDEQYKGEPVSLTMPQSKNIYKFDGFPPFFEGLLPEGIMLDGLLKINKLDKNDYFAQLIATGNDLVGAVTVKEAANE